MSLILDALKRSEAQRLEAEQSPTGLVMLQDRQVRRTNWLLWGLSALLALTLIALALLYFASHKQPVPSTLILQTETEPFAAKQRATETPLAPASTNQSLTSRQELQAIKTAPTPLSAALPRVTQKPAGTADLTAPSIPVPTIDTTAQQQEAYQELTNAGENVRDFAARLELNTVVYSDKPQKSFALINMKKYRAGDALPGGNYQLDRITPEGVVLRHNDELVLLRAR